MSRERVQSDSVEKKEENSPLRPVIRPREIIPRRRVNDDNAQTRAFSSQFTSGGPLPQWTLQRDFRSESPTSGTRVVHKHDVTTNFSEEEIVITRRSSRKPQDPERASLSRSKYMDEKSKYITLYLNVGSSDVVKIQKCSDLVSYDVEIQYKYEELNFQDLLTKNMVRRRINCLTQTLGILEKYASNLIKLNRPAFWRQVKFTSSLVRTYLENVHGSYDILKQMGYTKVVPDGLSFPEEVQSPNVEMIKVIAADLFLAKYETDELIHGRHPYLEIKALQSPVDTASSKSPETINSEDSESEYEDAEDGLSAITETHAAALPQGAFVSPNLETRTPSSPIDDKQCHVCGENKVKFSCKECDEFFCADCVTKFHGNRKRQNHTISEITNIAGGDERRTGSPPNALYENHDIVKPAVQPRQPTAANRTVKKPIPTPRRRIPSAVKTPESQTAAPSRQTDDVARPSVAPSQASDELPPPPTYLRRTIQDPPFPQSSSRETIPRQPSTPGEREIKRPPPFEEPSAFVNEFSDESLYQSLRNPSEHLYEALDLNRVDEGSTENVVSPPTPPPRSKPESEPTVWSCPHCYCLNEKNVTKCVACGTLLTKSQQTIPGRTALSQRPSGDEENSTFNIPVQSLRARSDPLPGRQTFYENQTYRSHISAASTSNVPEKPPSRATTSSYQGIPEQKSRKWQCQHCTFHNDMGTNICEVCSRTTDHPVEIQSEDPISRTTASQLYDPRPSTNMARAYDPRPMSTYTAHDPISSRSMAPSTSYDQPSHIKHQDDEKLSLWTKSSILSHDILSMQQREEEFIAGRVSLLQQARQTTQQLPSPPAMPSPVLPYNVSSPVVQRVVPSPGIPPMAAHSEYPSSQSSGGSTSDYGNSQEVLQYLKMEESRKAGEQFVKLLKEAETLGFSAEELNIAYNLSPHEDNRGPIYWLQTEWFDRIHKVMVEFTNISIDENYGNISPEEAREALTEHTGDVKEASQKCVKDRKQKLNEVMKSGVYIRTDVVKALDVNDGVVEQAIQHLQRMSFEPMLQRIKDSCLNDHVDNREPPHVARQLSTSQDDEIFEAIVSNKEIDMDRRVRVMFAEKNFVSWGRASTAIKLIDMEFPVSDSIEAAKVNGDLDRSIQFLQRECTICTEKYPESRMVTMLNCQCRFCRDCVSQQFSLVIHEQNIMKLVCPECSEPKNLEDAAIAAEYFNHIDILIRLCVDRETHDLFQRKLRDRTLMQEPNFRWCSHCSSGFINERPNILKMACPNCHKYTCFQCKKEWEDQHDGITCEQFAAWKEANDPEAQANGLAAHLKQNGIECPNCKFRYDLAKGGCMHFKCVQCSHEFCSGCYQPFRHNQHCPVSAECAKRGLHAHHPRDCLFYLRDRDPNELKKLLDDHNIEYNTEPPQRQPAGEEVQGAAAADTGLCKVMEQREAGGGLEDVECGRETPAGYAGLCRIHFSEYLVERINSNFIDPVGIFSIDNLKAVLGRNDLQMPAKQNREKDKDYLKRMVQYVQEKLPLPRKTPRRRVLDVEDPLAGLQAQAVNELRVEDLEQEDGLPFIDYDSDFGDNDSGAEQSDDEQFEM